MSIALDRLSESVAGRSVVEDSRSRLIDRVFRPDIQGLRAIAVVLVVLYHCGVPGLRGGYVGVDVFFVISGFLITRQLLGELGRTGTVSLPRFYARRIRRLLPAALLVIGVTVLVARIWGPPLQSTTTARHGIFAALYATNYRLASEGINYQNADAAPSPLQHFWSLAVEEQFYILWPAAILLVLWLTRRASHSVRTAALAVTIIGAVSLSLRESVAITATNGPLAYFSLQTRAWELGVGALLALAVPLLARVPHRLAAALSWLAVVPILAAAVLFDEATPFPGWLAAVPVGGAALLIASGVAARGLGIETVLRNRVIQFFGRMSYGWYLWHFPAIILGPSIFGLEFGALEKVEMSVLALWLAVLTHLLIELPNNRSALRLRRWFITGGALSASVVLIAVGVITIAPAVQGRGAVVATLDLHDPETAKLTDAIELGTRIVEVPANLDPTLSDAAESMPVTSHNGCHLGVTVIIQPPCIFGDPKAPRTILLFGDSHAEQWFGALDRFATENHWRLVSWTKAGCPLADISVFNRQVNREYTECNVWRSDRLAAALALQPDVIVASQTDVYAGNTLPEQTAATLKKLRQASRHVDYIQDTPRPIEDMPSCVAAHLETPSECNIPATSGMSRYLSERRSAILAAVTRLDITDVDPTQWFCTAKACPPIVGNVLVYRDASHMTQVYSRALAPLIARIVTS